MTLGMGNVPGGFFIFIEAINNDFGVTFSNHLGNMKRFTGSETICYRTNFCNNVGRDPTLPR
jgi:hypothetical protein